MSKNAIHNFNLSIQNSADIKSSEDLTKTIIKELAKVSKEMSQQKYIVQEWQEQKKQNTAAFANNSIASTKGGAIDTTAEIKKTALSIGNTPLVNGETMSNLNVSSGTISLPTTSTSSALIGGGAVDTADRTTMSSVVSDSTTPSTAGAENNTLNFSSGITTQTYASVAAQQMLTVPQAFQTNNKEPKTEVVKAEIKKRLEAAMAANNTVEATYWRNISKAFDEGATAEDFDGKKDHDRFAKMYFDLQKWRLATIDEITINNINWEDASELMVIKLLQLSDDVKNKNLKGYYKRMIKEIRNPDVNIQKLFSEHDELFLLLKSVFPNLPDKITIQTTKSIYLNLSPQKMYPDIGVEQMYFVWSGNLLDNIEIKYGKGERIRDKNGKYPALKEGQWYDFDRINNPIKEGSTFWKASVYNTINEQHYFYNTIGQRHAYYQFVDAYLKTKGIISEWFDAAARVTIGSIKEAIDGEIALGSAEMINLWYLSDNTDDFLKGGNKYLFSDNMNNVKLLLEGKGKLSGEFVDALGNKQSFKNLSKQELDLKLVEFEQSLVQDYINSSFKNLNNSLLKKALEEGSSTSGNKEFDSIIKEINENFTHWMAPDIMQDIMEKHFTKEGKVIFNFAKYEDRVKLGQVMVKELYYLRLSDTFKVNNIDKILENPKQSSILTADYFIIDQKNAVKEKSKYLKEYKILERLERLKNNISKKIIYILINLDEIFKFGEDTKDAISQEFLKSLLNISVEVNLDLKELSDEIAQEFEKNNRNDHYNKRHVDLIKKIYDEIADLEKTRIKLNGKIAEKIMKIGDKVVNEVKNLPDEIAVNLLTKVAKRIYPEVEKLGEQEKKILFKKSYEATVAILLYEFAKGEGREIRNFDYHEHKFAQAILKDRMIDEIMEETLKLLRQTNYDFVNKPDSKDLKLDLEFSPTPTYILESIDKHFDSNLAQIFIGGAFALVRVKNKKLEGYVYNKTSKESLMVHLNVGNRNRKNDGVKEKELSTIVQRIYFTFKLP